MNTGSILGGRPCLGSWSLYGLGSECENLPGFIVMLDSLEDPPGGNRNWSTGFMPATFQGTKFRDGKAPILHVAEPDSAATLARSASEAGSPLASNRQRSKIDFIQQLNAQHRAER